VALPKPLTIELGMDKNADFEKNSKSKSFYAENFFPHVHRLCSLY
jgi:hypothetical protein